MAIEKANFDQMLLLAQMRLPGASLAGIKAELFDVLKEFFKDSNSWTEDILLTPIAAVQDYDLEPSDDGQIIRLVGLFDNKGIPIPAYMPTFAQLRLPNVPSPPLAAGVKWTARVVKTVVLPTDGKDIPFAPDWVLGVYEDAILDGLCGRMMAQMGKSYTNPQQSGYHLKRFRVGIANARTAAIRQNTVGAQEWAYPRGWSTSSQRGGVSTAWPSRAF